MASQTIDFAHTDFGQEEIEAVNRVLQSYWLGPGPENEAFEQEFAKLVGANYAVCVNSGSSANLLALAALQLPAGSRVLTSACGFPATLAPILHLGLEPVLVDYDLRTHNIDLEQLLKQLPTVRAVILAHTLGNPVDMERIDPIVRAAGIPLIEDCCEAVGTRINQRWVGTFGTAGTFSFYPSHQITALGGGGMVITNDATLARGVRSRRDWGKWVAPTYTLGEEMTSYQTIGGSFPIIRNLPYYSGYTYQTIGYNCKLPDANAAFGRVQLKRLEGFVKQRLSHYEYLKQRLNASEHFLPVVSPPGALVSWFGFPLTVAKGNRDGLGLWLEGHGIRHRPFFAGNLLRHAPFRHLGDPAQFPIADRLMRDGCFIGVWQGITQTQLDYMVETILAWCHQH